MGFWTLVNPWANGPLFFMRCDTHALAFSSVVALVSPLLPDGAASAAGLLFAANAARLASVAFSIRMVRTSASVLMRSFLRFSRSRFVQHALA